MVTNLTAITSKLCVTMSSKVKSNTSSLKLTLADIITTSLKVVNFVNSRVKCYNNNNICQIVTTDDEGPDVLWDFGNLMNVNKYIFRCQEGTNKITETIDLFLLP